jgi:hypothetical protein
MVVTRCRSTASESVVVRIDIQIKQLQEALDANGVVDCYRDVIVDRERYEAANVLIDLVPLVALQH